MIYAVPLTSLSPSSPLSALNSLSPLPLSSLPLAGSSPLLSPPRFNLAFSSLSLPPLPLRIPLSSLQSSLSNGDKGRAADYLSNGKKRKADEKEFMTDYVRTLL